MVSSQTKKATYWQYDCEYYVMKKMLDIISVFNDPMALTEDDLYDLRNQWATCFLDLYKA
ncbi:hypothetical protein MTR_3g028430 [Medicago truncatula]|uniref:Uncharacterized protein n=1 Tax=Medicago truncatula TaxID=3880 RepID=G7IZE9_MEDTR|nr:hypothetical protein MTR_3g028430 [Medicago truncatula]